MLEFRYDTQLLIEGENLDEDKISEYFTEIKTLLKEIADWSGWRCNSKRTG